LAAEFDPKLGITPGAAVGRDLRGVKWVIGTGGFFAHNHPDLGLAVLREVLSDPGLFLLPRAPETRVDSRYLLYAVGLLSRGLPSEALDFAKRYLEME
jgi:hypothetical protein